MTIKQFLNLKSMDGVRLVPLDAKVCFLFKDKYKIAWVAKNEARRFMVNNIISEFPCNLAWNKDKEAFYTFNLNLSKNLENSAIFFSEIYELFAKNSDEGNIAVQKYLQGHYLTVREYLQRHYLGKLKPKVFFRQKVFVENDTENDTYHFYINFTTRKSIPFEESIDGSFSNLFVHDVEAKDDAIIVEVYSNASFCYDLDCRL